VALRRAICHPARPRPALRYLSSWLYSTLLRVGPVEHHRIGRPVAHDSNRGCRTRYDAAMRARWATILSAAVVAALPAFPDDAATPPPPPRAVAPSPTEGIDSPALAALLVEHWDIEVARDPFWGTWIGDHRVDRTMPPIDDGEVGALNARRRALLDRVAALDT